jgi:hypothetical protein
MGRARGKIWYRHSASTLSYEAPRGLEPAVAYSAYTRLNIIETKKDFRCLCSSQGRRVTLGKEAHFFQVIPMYSLPQGTVFHVNIGKRKT